MSRLKSFFRPNFRFLITFFNPKVWFIFDYIFVMKKALLLNHESYMFSYFLSLSYLPLRVLECTRILNKLQHSKIENCVKGKRLDITRLAEWRPTVIGRNLIWALSWENLFLSYANNKGAEHPRRLISAFVVRCLDNIISLVSIFQISRL